MTVEKQHYAFNFTNLQHDNPKKSANGLEKMLKDFIKRQKNLEDSVNEIDNKLVDAIEKSMESKPEPKNSGPKNSDFIDKIIKLFELFAQMR